MALYRKNPCEALIAIGGGSSMDCAKPSVHGWHTRKKENWADEGYFACAAQITDIDRHPTTAGTGSEATLAAVITDTEKQHKVCENMSFPLIPHYAVLDASLTYSLPRHLTSTTGMDALTHTVEAYIGRSRAKKQEDLPLKQPSLFSIILKWRMQTVITIRRAKICSMLPKGGCCFQNLM